MLLYSNVTINNFQVLRVFWDTKQDSKLKCGDSNILESNASFQLTILTILLQHKHLQPSSPFDFIPEVRIVGAGTPVHFIKPQTNLVPTSQARLHILHKHQHDQTQESMCFLKADCYCKAGLKTELACGSLCTVQISTVKNYSNSST